MGAAGNDDEREIHCMVFNSWGMQRLHFQALEGLAQKRFILLLQKTRGL